MLVWICRFPLPLGVWEWLRFVIVALPGLFSYLFNSLIYLRKHPRSLIRVFADRMCLLQPPGYPNSNERHPRMRVDVQDDLRLCWSHRYNCRICRALAQLCDLGSIYLGSICDPFLYINYKHSPKSDCYFSIFCFVLFHQRVPMF